MNRKPHPPDTRGAPGAQKWSDQMPDNSNPRKTADWQAPRLKRLMSAGESNKFYSPIEGPEGSGPPPGPVS